MIGGGDRLGRALLGLFRDIADHARSDLAVSGLFVALGAVFEAAGVIVLIPMASVVIGNAAPPGALWRAAKDAVTGLGAHSPLMQLILLSAAFGVVALVRAWVLYVRDMKLIRLQFDFTEALRLEVAAALARARWDTILRLRHARVTQVMSAEMQRVGLAAGVGMQCAAAAVMLLGQLLLACWLAPILFLGVSAMALVGALIAWPAMHAAYGAGGRMVRINLALIELTSRFLGGLKLAISHNIQGRFVDEFRALVLDLRASQIAQNRRNLLARLTLTTGAYAVGCLVLLVGFGLFHLPAPVLMGLMLLVVRITGPVAQLQNGAQTLVGLLPALETVKRLQADLARLDEAPAAPGASIAGAGPVIFRSVGFEHDPESESSGGVREFDLTITPGERLGVTGPSGAGKTTLLDLLLGLLEPQAGRIEVDGRLLDRPTAAAWRDCVAYVPQDPFLFHGTVRSNLSWAEPAASEEAQWAALRLARAEDFVRRLPQGLDTLIGERGATLSGGERQRIALARALIRRPRLLALDEATNAVDTTLERAIFAGLAGLESKPTIIVVAHREETLALCDRVIQMEAGRLAGAPRGAGA